MYCRKDVGAVVLLYRFSRMETKSEPLWPKVSSKGHGLYDIKVHQQINQNIVVWFHPI